MNSKINNKGFVKEQYKDDTGLLIRKKIHEKYSANKQGFGNWLFEIIDLPSEGRILELGSGNGDFWFNNFHQLNDSVQLTVSDFSNGMVGKMKKKFEDLDVTVRQIDIQEIPFDDNSFDVIIANAMLYHVPDMEKALAEVNRVLKPNGKFYTSTFGENGLSSFISTSLSEVGVRVSEESNYTFTLQNGSKLLSNHFGEVERLDYEDSLLVTKVQDLVDYIFSMTSMNGLTSENYDQIYEFFEKKMQSEGVIEIPKEYGSFISMK
ncbi:class I SAM-dependent methyltransferase [Acidaminobacter sp. JC074]|uniref:class I SAM-dependent methyltransferase n=1 Tax=Acidaminobacter sp. JC074 TaxID=2530199 RepID=UPI001F10F043